MRRLSGVRARSGESSFSSLSLYLASTYHNICLSANTSPNTSPAPGTTKPSAPLSAPQTARKSSSAASQPTSAPPSSPSPCAQKATPSSPTSKPAAPTRSSCATRRTRACRPRACSSFLSSPLYATSCGIGAIRPVRKSCCRTWTSICRFMGRWRGDMRRPWRMGRLFRGRSSLLRGRTGRFCCRRLRGVGRLTMRGKAEDTGR